MVGLGLNVFAVPEGIPNATYLAKAKGMGDALSIDRWQNFLHQLDKEFSTTCHQAIRDHLNECQRRELLKALNANPHLNTPILEMGAQGDLITKNGKIPWYDI